MMKRATILVTTYAYLVLLWSQGSWGTPPEAGSPEAVVAKAIDALNHGRIDEFVSAMHPDSLKEFRTAVLPEIDVGVKRVGAAKLLEGFPGVKTVAALKRSTAEIVCRRHSKKDFRPEHEEIPRQHKDQGLRPRP